MSHPAPAGASALRLFRLFDLWGNEADRVTCTPSDLPLCVEFLHAYGLTDNHRATLASALSDLGGTGRHSASTGAWRLTSEPVPVREGAQVPLYTPTHAGESHTHHADTPDTRDALASALSAVRGRGSVDMHGWMLEVVG